MMVRITVAANIAADSSRTRLRRTGIRLSRSRRGDCCDSASTESL